VVLSSEENARYARQLLLPEIGEAGQQKLKAASVLIIGAGGLGSPAAYYLAAAGIGRLGLMDADRVDVSTLHRQLLHFTPDVGHLKTESARQKLSALNPGVQLETMATRLTAANSRNIFESYAFIISAVDNFETKFIISDACVRENKPFCHAGILGFEGLMFTYVPESGSGCYRCFFSVPPPEGKIPRPAPVLGPVPGVMGALQAVEALKYLLGLGGLLTNRLLCFNALGLRFREVAFGPKPECPGCGKSRK
jgi:adenylyltransferase/sulfurtransferase